MPTTVTKLFSSAGLTAGAVTRWGSPVALDAPGVYAVALTDDPDATASAMRRAPIDLERIEHLLRVRPEFSLDARRPTAEEVASRLQAFWLPDEVVLYVGRAGTSVKSRAARFQATPLGARQPHAGGWWLKTLSNLDRLWVHYAAAADDAAAEETMLRHFADHVSNDSRHAAYDSVRLAPFANVGVHDSSPKAHGIRGATGDLAQPPSAGRRRVAAAAPTHVAATDSPGQSQPTQKVSPKDLAAGQIRLPRRTKPLLPADGGTVSVVLRGQPLQAKWDPRTGPGRERSGLLAFGTGALAGVVQAGEVLQVSVGGADDIMLG